MKIKKYAGKIIPIIYLSCCLVIALTPNTHKEDKSITERKNHPETQLKYAEEDELSVYEDQLEDAVWKLPLEHDGITSIIVMKDGKVYSEHYYNGAEQNSLLEVHSCTKAVIALCTGIAIDQGFIRSEKESYINLFNNLEIPSVSKGMENVTIENLLSMSSGINWVKYSNSFWTKIKIIKNGLSYGLNLIPTAPVIHEPGSYFFYDSNESRSLLAMVAYASGLSDIEFAKKYLFDKLEIYDFIWPYNDSGILPGSKDLFLSSKDLAKIGQLILDKGNYNGQQIVSEQWIEKMLTPVMFSVPCEDIQPKDKVNYSYYLWNTNYNGHEINFAYGKGGQYIFLVPDMNICLVTSAIDKVRSDSFREIIYQVIDVFSEEGADYE